MKRRSDSTDVREQTSIFYFLPGQAGVIPRPFGELYTHMFLEDVSRALLPVSALRHDSDAVKITPANAVSEDVLSAALDVSRQGYGHRDLGWVLGEFLRLTLVELCIERRAVFEIVFFRPKPEEPRDRFILFHINPRQVVRHRRSWYQIVPPDIARERQVAERIPLPSENIAVFTLPDHLGRPVASAMETLSASSDHRWHGLALQAQKEQLPYDFSTHERSMRAALAESVREIGWTARGSFNDKVTNYYSLRQELRFRLFALQLREALLAQLNVILQRVGAVLGWSAQLSISGLPTRSDIEQALVQLASGEKPFTEIMKAIRNL